MVAAISQRGASTTLAREWLALAARTHMDVHAARAAAFGVRIDPLIVAKQRSLTEDERALATALTGCRRTIVMSSVFVAQSPLTSSDEPTDREIPTRALLSGNGHPAHRRLHAGPAAYFSNAGSMTMESSGVSHGPPITA